MRRDLRQVSVYPGHFIPYGELRARSSVVTGVQKARSSPPTVRAAFTTCSSPRTHLTRRPPQHETHRKCRDDGRARRPVHPIGRPDRRRNLGRTLRCLLARAGAPTPGPEPQLDPARAYRPWDVRTAPPHSCPVTEMINEPLGADVDRRLVVWAAECGFSSEEAEQLGKPASGGWRCSPTPIVTPRTGCRSRRGSTRPGGPQTTLYADDTALVAVQEQLLQRPTLAMVATDPLASGPVGRREQGTIGKRVAGN